MGRKAVRISQCLHRIVCLEFFFEIYKHKEMDQLKAKYDYGPNVDFNIKFVGKMEELYGKYEDQTEHDKIVIQIICHMIYQIKNIITASGDDMFGFFILGTSRIMFHRLPRGMSYNYYNSDCMSTFQIIEIGFHSYEIEFYSQTLNELLKLHEYAYYHALQNGRTE